MTVGETDDMSMHHGEAFFHLASTYKYLLKTLVEAAQNGIDADAETILICVDSRERLAVVLDDGRGITREKFQQALLSVGKGIKEVDRIGRFGLGMISPLNKCREFTITSKPMGQGRVVNEWSFEGEYIRGQHGRPQIPYKKIEAMPAIPAQFAQYADILGTQWRTALRVTDIIDNRSLTDIDPETLESQIRTKLRRAMIQKGTTIHVVLIDEDGVTQFSVDASQPTGEPFEVFEINDPKLPCGSVKFTFYKAKEDAAGRRRGIVDVMKSGDNTAVEWRDFRAQALGVPDLKRLKLTDKVKIPFDALSSGFFEGTIEIEQVELDASRDDFKVTPQLTSSYVAIYEWFLKVGQQHYQEEKTVRRDDRYRELGERALERLYERLEAPSFKTLVSGVAGLLPDHDVFSSDRPVPRDPSKPGAKPPKKVMARRPNSKRDSEPRAREAATFRITFAYDILPGSKKLWVMDITSGLITFNVRHPTWVGLDQTAGKHTAKNDEDIVQLQLYTALEVLKLLRRVGREEFDEAREEADLGVEWYVEMFLTEDGPARRRRSTRTK